MRAIQVQRNGGPEVLDVVEVPVPQPREDQTLVRVRYAGVNFIDVYHRSGLYPLPLPYMAGVEGVGSVTAVGEGARDLAVGQRVGWLTGGQGKYHGLRNKAYGTQVVAGVTPGKGGTEADGFPVFDSVDEAVRKTGANCSLIVILGTRKKGTKLPVSVSLNFGKPNPKGSWNSKDEL